MSTHELSVVELKDDDDDDDSFIQTWELYGLPSEEPKLTRVSKKKCSECPNQVYSAQFLKCSDCIRGTDAFHSWSDFYTYAKIKSAHVQRDDLVVAKYKRERRLLIKKICTENHILLFPLVQIIIMYL